MMKSFLTNWPVMVNHTLLPNTFYSTHKNISSLFQVLWDSSQILANLSSNKHFLSEFIRILVMDKCHVEVMSSPDETHINEPQKSFNS